MKSFQTSVESNTKQQLLELQENDIRSSLPLDKLEHSESFASRNKRDISPHSITSTTRNSSIIDQTCSNPKPDFENASFVLRNASSSPRISSYHKVSSTALEISALSTSSCLAEAEKKTSVYSRTSHDVSLRTWALSSPPSPPSPPPFSQSPNSTCSNSSTSSPGALRLNTISERDNTTKSPPSIRSSQPFVHPFSTQPAFPLTSSLTPPLSSPRITNTNPFLDQYTLTHASLQSLSPSGGTLTSNFPSSTNLTFP